MPDAAYSGPIGQLPVRHQRAYERRKLDNMVKHSLPPKEAEAEARRFVGCLVAKEKALESSQKSQMSLFDLRGGTRRV